MKIIDFIIHGNQVKFFLGANNCNNYWGDDWNDRPYEHNAGTVYSEFIEGYFIKTFDWDFIVREPADGARDGNSRYSKEDMINRRVPCVVAVDEKYHNHWDDSFESIIGNKNAIKFYFGDEIDESKENIIYLKERKDEDLYIEICCDINDKILNSAIYTIGTSLKYISNDKYLRDFDNEYYEKIEQLSLYKYKTFINDIIKSICKMYKIKNVEDIINSIKIDIVNKRNMSGNKDKRFYVCCQSNNNFNIGEIIIR